MGHQASSGQTQHLILRPELSLACRMQPWSGLISLLELVPYFETYTIGDL